jgi:hypothetical protein
MSQMLATSNEISNIDLNETNINEEKLFNNNNNNTKKTSKKRDRSPSKFKFQTKNLIF